MTSKECTQELNRLHLPLFSFALHLTDKHESAETLIRETSLCVQRHRKRIGSRQEVGQWACVIMRIIEQDGYHRASSRQAVDQQIKALANAPERRRKLFDRSKVYLRIEAFDQMINSLDPVIGNSLLLYLRGSSPQEIAENSGLSYEKVKSFIQRAKRMVKAFILERARQNRPQHINEGGNSVSKAFWADAEHDFRVKP
ncbi:MAG: sigma factor-like helix-turn-helix DNA-binding protein [Bacteroidota bacterium]